MYSEYSLNTYGGADAIPISRKATENKTKNHHFGVHSPGGKINNKQKKKRKIKYILYPVVINALTIMEIIFF